MRFRSLRSRLVAWFVTAAALLLLAFSLALYTGVRAAVLAGLDAELRARADGLVQRIEWDEDTTGPEIERHEDEPGPGAATPSGVASEVRTWPEGQLVHRAGAVLPATTATQDALGRELSAGRRPGRAERLRTVRAAGHPLRLLVRIVRIGPRPDDHEEGPAPGYTVVVRAGKEMQPTEALLGRVAWIIAVLALVTLAASVAFAGFLSRHLLRPLEALGAAASSVRADAPHAMPRTGSGDEIDRLAGILDDAFRSLQRAWEEQARFTADASHELRNPVAILRSAAEVALRRERSGKDYRPFLEDIRAAAERMAAILDALLVLARLDAGRIDPAREAVDLAAVVRDHFGTLSAAAAGRCDLEAPEPCPKVAGNSRLLDLLVRNLVANALHYSDPPAPVHVRIAGDPGGVVLEVEDRGIGIPEPEQDRVFDRFYRGVRVRDEGRKGIGLGLALVARIASFHAARLDLLSRVGRGSTFRVLFRRP